MGGLWAPDVAVAWNKKKMFRNNEMYRGAGRVSRHNLYISMQRIKKTRVLTNGVVDFRFLYEVMDNSMFLSTEPILMYHSLLLFTIHYSYISCMG